MRSVIATLFLLIAVQTVTATIGGDVSQFYPTSTWECAVKSGWEFVVVRSYLSYGAVDPNVGNTLAAAKAGGIAYRDIYHFPCVGMSASSQIKADISNVGVGNFGTIWMDVEPNPTSGCGWTSDHASNCKFLADMISTAQSMGANVGVYSSANDWSQTVGDSCTAGADADAPLWYAHYDQSKSFSDFSPFGGWTEPHMKQYNDAVSGSCGINADADWY